MRHGGKIIIKNNSMSGWVGVSPIPASPSFAHRAGNKTSCKTVQSVCADLGSLPPPAKEPLLLQVVSRETEQSDEAEEAGSADFVRGTPERAR